MWEEFNPEFGSDLIVIGVVNGRGAVWLFYWSIDYLASRYALGFQASY